MPFAELYTVADTYTYTYRL